MTGIGVRVYTDENVDVKLAEQLRRHGYDAISCRDVESHNQGRSDNWQLSYATDAGRAILTHNVADFVRLDREWRAAGNEHGGIICVPAHPPIGDLVNRTIRHLDACSPEDQFNTIHWI